MFVEVYIFHFCFKLEFVHGFEVLLLKTLKKLLPYYDKTASWFALNKHFKNDETAYLCVMILEPWHSIFLESLFEILTNYNHLNK